MAKKFIMGTDLMLFKDNTTPLAFAKSCSVDINVNTLEVSSKDSGYFTEKLAGKISWSAKSDNLFTVEDYKSLVDLMLLRQPIQIQFSTATGTAPDWTPVADGYKGKGIITSISVSANDGEVSTYSISIEGTGALEAVAV